MLRYIIKNNLAIFMNNPFYVCIKYFLKKKYFEVVDVLDTFYYSIKEKEKILENIKEWYLVYKNESFWDKKINEQIEDLHLIRDIIKANFDTSKGGAYFGIKMVGILRNTNSFARILTLETITERLRNIFVIMGENFFKKTNIPIYSVKDFYELETEEIIKYTNIVYLKTIDVINITINLFENYNMICLKLENLLNYCFVNIEEDNILEDDIEDISYLMN